MDELRVFKMYLPLLLIFLPILGAVFLYLAGTISSLLRNILLLIITGVNLLLLILFYPLLKQSLLVFELREIMDYGLKFSMDMTGFLFAFLISLLWFLASIYAIDYMAHEKNQNRFYFFFLLVLGGTLGTVLAENLFTLFVFFELMSLGSYVLVVHKEDALSLSAGKKYLFMSIAGGLALLMGIFMIFYYTGSLEIKSLTQELAHLGWVRYLISFFFFLGFGVKAGMIPLHIWLPEAHPVAPSPASALLSGIMIKVGVYGFIRTINSIFSPSYHLLFSGQADWSLSQNLGYTLILFGAITMFGGAFLALFQENMKKILAYSSVSQIGYILMGVGVAGYMGSYGFIGLGAALYHVMSHAFFKGSLFMVAGIIYVKAHELNIYRLGGLYKKMPLTTIAFIIGMFGIIGVPGFTGYISKTLLHEAIIESYYFQGDRLLYYVEKVFKLTSAMTVVYFTKMLIPAFFGKASEKVQSIDERSLAMKFSLIALSLGILLLGLFPQLILDSTILLVKEDFSFAMTGSIGEIDFWGQKALVEGSLATIIAGVSIYLIFWFSSLFQILLPKKIGFEHLFYRPLYRLFFLLSEVFVNLFDKRVDIAQQKTAQLFMYFIRLFVPLFDDSSEKKEEERSSESAPMVHPLLLRFSRFFSNLIDERIVDEEGRDIEKSLPSNPTNPDEVDSSQEIRSMKDVLVMIRRSRIRSDFDHVRWDVKNLDFGLFVIVLFLLLFFIMFFPSIYSF